VLAREGDSTMRKGRDFVLVAVMGILFGGCLTQASLRHRETGETVTCGPYRDDPAGRTQLRDCVHDFERRGYDWVSK